MSLWDDVAADDAAFTFLDPDALGAEAVTYTAKATGVGRTVYAQVFREPYLDLAGKPTPSARVFVRRHATAGTLTVDKDGDTVTLAERLNGTAKAHPIAEIVSEDAGGFMLRLR